MKTFARLVITLGVLLAPVASRAQNPDVIRGEPDLAGKVDAVLGMTASLHALNAPGCVVGVAQNGKIVERAFGLAEIELGVPLTPQSILESGSVAKQFTAASIVLLVIDGKLRLDDPVKKYIPELPDYGAPLNIRHLLNHTSGIRDWGSVLELTGFGRGDRVVSQALALDVITHQRGIDFTPGAEYSYSNSGYTLLATIVERVSGQSLPVFTAERFFKPLGMTHTTWRDDYTRLVPGRAQAYAPAAPAGYKLDMPFMNVYGNGGMLTTVGDWLKWNAMLESRSMGSALVDSVERQAVLNDGRTIPYALGVEVTTYHGVRQVAHSGSTAGYAAYLTRFPALKLSIAVMCNGARITPARLALALADKIGGLEVPAATVAAPQRPPQASSWTPTTAELAALSGTWHSDEAEASFAFVVVNGEAALTQRLARHIVLRPTTRDHFATQGMTVWFTRDEKQTLTMHIGASRMRDMPFTRVSR